jgi:hypothetical protein
MQYALYHAQWAVLRYSLPVQNAAKMMSSDATSFLIKANAYAIIFIFRASDI